jgi:hypothetical protein
MYLILSHLGIELKIILAIKIGVNDSAPEATPKDHRRTPGIGNDFPGGVGLPPGAERRRRQKPCKLSLF